MPWEPTDPPPSADAILAELEPEAGEGDTGYVTPEDVQAAIGGVLSIIAATPTPQPGLAERWANVIPELRVNKAAIPGIGYMAREGYGVRIGHLVYVQGYIMLTGKGTLPAQVDPQYAYLQVHGLPWPARLGSDQHALVQVHPCDDVTRQGVKGWEVRGLLDNGETFIALQVPGSGANLDRLKWDDIGPDFVVRFACTYVTDAG